VGDIEYPFQNWWDGYFYYFGLGWCSGVYLPYLHVRWFLAAATTSFECKAYSAIPDRHTSGPYLWIRDRDTRDGDTRRRLHIASIALAHDDGSTPSLGSSEEWVGVKRGGHSAPTTPPSSGRTAYGGILSKDAAIPLQNTSPHSRYRHATATHARNAVYTPRKGRTYRLDALGEEVRKTGFAAPQAGSRDALLASMGCWH
jgi:hypothetical protein